MKVTETAIEVYALGMAEFLEQAKEDVGQATQDDEELEEMKRQNHICSPDLLIAHHEVKKAVEHLKEVLERQIDK